MKIHMKSPQNDPLSDGKYEFATLKGWGKEYWKGSKSIEIAQILVDWNVEFQLNYYYILHPFRTMSLWKRSDSNRKFLQPSWTNSEITRDILGEKRFILWDSYLTSLMGGPRRKCPSMSTKLPFGRFSEIRPKQIPGWFCDGASVINRGALLFLGGIIELHLAQSFDEVGLGPNHFRSIYKFTKYMKVHQDNWRWAKVVTALHLSFFLLLQRRVRRILLSHILVRGVFWKACKNEERANRYKYRRTPFRQRLAYE